MFGYYKIIASHCFTAAVVDFGHWYNVTVLKIGWNMPTLQYNINHTEVSPRERRDDMPSADGSSTAANIAAGLRPSADGSAVRTSLVAEGG